MHPWPEVRVDDLAVEVRDSQPYAMAVVRQRSKIRRAQNDPAENDDVGQEAQDVGGAVDAITDGDADARRSDAVVETTREPSAANRWVAPVICRPTLSPGWPSNGGNIFDTSGNICP